MSFASEEGVFEFVLNTAHTKSESEYAPGFRLVVKGLVSSQDSGQLRSHTSGVLITFERDPVQQTRTPGGCKGRFAIHLQIPTYYEESGRRKSAGTMVLRYLVAMAIVATSLPCVVSSHPYRLGPACHIFAL